MLLLTRNIEEACNFHLHDRQNSHHFWGVWLPGAQSKLAHIYYMYYISSALKQKSEPHPKGFTGPQMIPEPELIPTQKGRDGVDSITSLWMETYLRHKSSNEKQ